MSKENKFDIIESNKTNENDVNNKNECKNCNFYMKELFSTQTQVNYYKEREISHCTMVKFLCSNYDTNYQWNLLNSNQSTLLSNSDAVEVYYRNKVKNLQCQYIHVKFNIDLENKQITDTSTDKKIPLERINKTMVYLTNYIWISWYKCKIP